MLVPITHAPGNMIVEQTLISMTPFVPFADSCDSSLFIKDVNIKDGERMRPGTVFAKKWKIINTGSCGWNKEYSLQFVKGDQLSGETTYLTKWVPPGGTTVISVDMLAPQAEGTYTGYWIMTNEESTPFGSYLTVRINVRKKKP
jgi:hypothetical protein